MGGWDARSTPWQPFLQCRMQRSAFTLKSTHRICCIAWSVGGDTGLILPKLLLYHEYLHASKCIAVATAFCHGGCLLLVEDDTGFPKPKAPSLLPHATKVFVTIALLVLCMPTTPLYPDEKEETLSVSIGCTPAESWFDTALICRVACFLLDSTIVVVYFVAFVSLVLYDWLSFVRDVFSLSVEQYFCRCARDAHFSSAVFNLKLSEYRIPLGNRKKAIEFPQTGHYCHFGFCTYFSIF